MIYQTCLTDIPKILPRLCDIIEADYQIGEFEKEEEKFEESGSSSKDWEIVGRSGLQIVIHFKEYEGYLFIDIAGKGSRFEEGKEFLYESYINQGGNPDAQEKP